MVRVKFSFFLNLDLYCKLRVTKYILRILILIKLKYTELEQIGLSTCSMIIYPKSEGRNYCKCKHQSEF